MKTITIAVVCLALGFVAGSLLVRRELLELRQALAEQAAASRPAADGKDESAVKAAPRAERPVTMHDVFQRLASSFASNPPPPTVPPAVAERPPDQRRRPDAAALIRRQAEAWPERATERRNQLVAQAGLDEEESELFDDTINQFNDELAGLMQRWSAFIVEQQFLNEEMQVRMLNDFSGLAVAAYDQLYEVLPDSWRDDAGTSSEFRIRDFIDPQIFMPMTNILPYMRSGRGRFR